MSVSGDMSLRGAEQKLSDAYVRLRNMIPGALDTPYAPTPSQVYETTESALRATLEEVKRLRQYCSAAAADFDGVLTKLESAVGFSLADKFSATAKELRETSEFMRLAAIGKADGTLYDDELTQARCREGQLREALEPFADAAGEDDEDFPDETAVVVKFGRTTFYALRLKDFRRARAALASEGKPPA